LTSSCTQIIEIPYIVLGIFNLELGAHITKLSHEETLANLEVSSNAANGGWSDANQTPSGFMYESKQHKVLLAGAAHLGILNHSTQLKVSRILHPQHLVLPSLVIQPSSM